MDLLQNAAEWLGRTLAKSASSGTGSKRRTYRLIAGSHSIEIDATIGSSEYEITDQSDQRTVAKYRDFLVQAEQLQIDGERFEPSPSMRIEETYQGKTQSFAVIAPDGEHCFRYSDHHDTRIRIHTERDSQ